jgi:hypothetical protein
LKEEDQAAINRNLKPEKYEQLFRIGKKNSVLVELHKDPKFLENLRLKRRKLRTVRSEHKYENVGNAQNNYNHQFMSTGRMQNKRFGRMKQNRNSQVFHCDEVVKELESEAESRNNRQSLSSLCQEPFIMRQAAVQIQKMNIIKSRKDNAAIYELKIKQKRYDKLCEVLRNLNEKLKEDPELIRKLIELKQKNLEMEANVLEQTEYTNTLDYMSDRYKQMMLCKQQPLQNRLIAYEFLMDEYVRWKNNLDRLRKTETEEIPQIHFDSQPLKDEYMKIKQYEKFKEAWKMEEEEKKRQELTSPFSLKENNHHAEKTKNDIKKTIHNPNDRELQLVREYGKSMVKDAVDVVHNSQFDKPSCPYDPLKGLHIDRFFIDEEVRNSDTDALKRKNNLLKKSTDLTWRSQPSISSKEFVSREYIIMIKETMDALRSRKEHLANLKNKRDLLSQQFHTKNSEMTTKVTERIFQRNDRLSRDSRHTEAVNSDLGTDATHTSDQYNAYLIPMMTDEVERMLLSTKRDRNHFKMKLFKAQELVIAAWGVVGRICKEIRIVNNDGTVDTVDVIERNVSYYMSLWGLKFEKLMRNNKFIKAQYDRLMEINNQKVEKKAEKEANGDIYGFNRLNIRTHKNEEYSDGM